MEPLAPNNSNYVEKVRPKAINKTKNNDVQKRSVPGHLGPLGYSAPIVFSGFILKKTVDLGSLFESPDNLK